MGDGGIFQTPAEISKVTSMANRSLRLQVDTQESLTDENMARVMSLIEKYGHFCFLTDEREISLQDVIDIPPLPKREEDKKSPAERLRGVLFVWFQQKKHPGDYEDFYRTQMERFIDAVKEKLT